MRTVGWEFSGWDSDCIEERRLKMEVLQKGEGYVSGKSVVNGK